MADNQFNKANNSSDEIDLGQLFNLINKGFNNLFKRFLRLFLYLKRNALLLLGLVVIGVAIGYLLNQVVSKKLKTEVIVRPQLESKNYLYDVVNEIQANIKAKDTAFFSSIGIVLDNFDGLEVTIAPLDTKNAADEGEMEYLELLQNFENNGAVSEIIREELQNKSSFNHKITFFYKDRKIGEALAQKAITYINSNPYYNEKVQIYTGNAKERIAKDQELLAQADEIINSYVSKLTTKPEAKATERIVVDNEEQGDITELLKYKNALIRDIEVKKLELLEQSAATKVINFGKPQIVQKPLFGKNIVLIPLALIGLFFLVSFLKYLNRKSESI